MSKKLAFAVVLVALAAGCAKKNEPVVVAPVSTEPVYTSKYGK